MSSDKDLQSVQLERIKDISLSVRDAIRDSLPGPADQFLTMMIPGKSLNLQVSRVRNKAKWPILTSVVS